MELENRAADDRPGNVLVLKLHPELSVFHPWLKSDLFHPWLIRQWLCLAGSPSRPLV
jgi:hypothetical protein